MRVGGCLQGGGGAVGVGSSAGDGAALLGTGLDGDVEGAEGEVGDEGRLSRDGEGIGLGGGDDLAVARPVQEVVSRVGRCDEGAGGAVVIDAVAGDRAAVDRVGDGGDGVAAETEVGYEAGRLVDDEAVGGTGGNLVAAAPPVEELVAVGGRCHKGAGVAVVVVAAAGDGALEGGAGDGGDRDVLELEVGDVVGCARHLELVGRGGGDQLPVERPSCEVVAHGRRGGEGAGGEVLIDAFAGDGAALGRTGRYGDLIAVDGEVGHIVRRTDNLKLVTLGSPDNVAVKRPAHEMVPRGRRCHQGAGREVLVAARPAHRAALGRIHGGGDLVGVQGEVGHVMRLARNQELVGFRRAHDTAVQRPVHKMVPRRRRCHQGAGGEMLIAARPAHRAALRRIHGGGDLIAVQSEVGHIVRRTRNHELVGLRGADHTAVQGPAHEMVPRRRRCHQGAYIKVLVSPGTFHRASGDRTGRRGNLVAVEGEVGHVVRRASDLKLVGLRSADHGAVQGPVHEVVTRGRGGHQGAGVEVMVGTSACDRAALQGIHGGGDLVAHQVEVGHQYDGAGDDDAVGGGGGDHGVVPRPADELVARGGHGGDGGDGAVVIDAGAGDGARAVGVDPGVHGVAL